MISLFQSPQEQLIRHTHSETQKISFPKKAIFCKQCLNEITAEIFSTEKNHSSCHSFANPYGYIFTIRCFSKAPGTITSGKGSNEFSWFTEYFWQVALCKKCMTHLGWKFLGTDDSFYGLIDDKLI